MTELGEIERFKNKSKFCKESFVALWDTFSFNTDGFASGLPLMAIGPESGLKVFSVLPWTRLRHIDIRTWICLGLGHYGLIKYGLDQEFVKVLFVLCFVIGATHE